jgi:uncharacterized membrane protein (DUF2068 family)
VPRFHWELLVCGTAGHALVGTEARVVGPQDAPLVRDGGRVRWYRCLRCDSWVALEPPVAPARETVPEREEIVLPLRGRPLRDKIVLRLIAVNRAVHFVVLALLGAAILLFSANRADLHHVVLRIMTDLNGGTASSGAARHGLQHEIDQLFSLQSSRLHLLAAVALVYALVEGIEAVGLWYARRWAEYLTFLVTASLLPLEIYELIHHATPFKVVALVINVAVVAYLLFAKRLFGVRGGVAADEALREQDMGWPALEAATPPAGVP